MKLALSLLRQLAPVLAFVSLCVTVMEQGQYRLCPIISEGWGIGAENSMQKCAFGVKFRGLVLIS